MEIEGKIATQSDDYVYLVYTTESATASYVGGLCTARSAVQAVGVVMASDTKRAQHVDPTSYSCRRSDTRIYS